MIDRRRHISPIVPEAGLDAGLDSVARTEVELRVRAVQEQEAGDRRHRVAELGVDLGARMQIIDRADTP
ncbi:hypothetical protein D3C71_1223320 [compost metagenome]